MNAQVRDPHLRGAMEDDGVHAEPASSSGSGSMHTIPQQQELLLPSRSSAPSSPTGTGTLSRFGLKSPTAAGPSSPGHQVSAITVVALLDKLVNMMESVQDNQRRMETRQGDLEQAVRVLQGDVTRLTKNHLATSACVTKLLERSRKVNGHVKEVKERLDRQAVQVKKLEANHNHLLKRNHFKVLIFQVSPSPRHLGRDLSSTSALTSSYVCFGVSCRMKMCSDDELLL